MNGLFVVGTDTGIGKTLVAAGLARLLSNNGIHVGVMKPVATGGKPSRDGQLLKKGARLPQSLYPEIVPIHYKQALSPFVASWKEGLVPMERINKTFKLNMKKYDYLIVEGIGGVLVPIKVDFFVVDWIKKWKLPALVVARAGLGTLNHTLLTVEALQKRKVKIKGILLNGFKGKTDSEKTNVSALKKILNIPIYGPLKFNPLYRTDFDLLAKDLNGMGINLK